jgi:arginine N-succinyltransferase
MLESEGFVYDRYIDIFDGGPTVTANTDQIRTVRDAEEYEVAEIVERGSQKALVATGRLKEFRAGCADIRTLPGGKLCIDGGAAKALDLSVGDKVVAVPR